MIKKESRSILSEKTIRSLLKSAEKLNEVLWESALTKHQQNVIKKHEK